MVGNRIQNDNAIDSAELFNFDAYSSALADIISGEETSTPLTIGIFGDWGSGKTSLMSTIKHNLGNDGVSGVGPSKVKCIWFNAWEQSFGQEGVLTTGPSLLYHIYKELDEELNKTKGMAAKAKKIGWRGVKVVFDVLLRRGGNITLGEVEDGLKDETIYHASLADIFHGAIKEYIKLTGCGRVVVFIDDMDRCLPESAVEVLETIKLFLNAEHCIFVLGVDRRVITESIRVRYKDFFRDGAESPITGDNYLEKIIQLSFQLPPIRTKDIVGFIEKLNMPDFYKPYIGMISEGIEQNPRKVKRFLNNIELQRTLANKIEGIKPIMEDKTKRGIFETLLIEWAIISSYYPLSIRRDLMREPILLAEMHEYVRRGEEPLFRWGNIPGDDNKKLLTYLMDDYALIGIESAKITKSKDNKSIHIVKGENTVEITIDDEKNKATLIISGGKPHYLKVEDEDDGLNIYVEVSTELENFLESGVGIRDLKNLIRAFPPNAKLPGEGDVKLVIHLSRATEPPIEKTVTEKALTKDEILDAIKNEKDLKDFNMSNVDLNGVDLSGVDLRGVNLSGANLSNAILKGIDLSSANLNGANLHGAKLNDAKLTRANLSDTDLSGAILRGADLSNADLSGKTNLSGVNLVKAYLRRANMNNCTLSDNADLRQCDLWYVHLENADLSGADLRGAEFYSAHMEGASFKNADLGNTSLLGADLREAKFKGAKFSNSTLDRADLRGADFKGADIDASTRIHSLKKARWGDAKFDDWVRIELEKSL